MNKIKETKKHLIEKLEEAHLRIAELEEALEARGGGDRAPQTSYAFLQALLNATTEGAILIDATGKVLAVNETQARRLGTSIPELIGRSVYDFASPEVVARKKPILERVLQSGRPVRFEDERAGYLLDMNVYPVIDAKQGVKAVAIYAEDVTERRKTEQALQASYEDLDRRIHERTVQLQRANERLREEIEVRELTERALRASEERYRTIFFNAPVGIEVIDSEGRFLSVNRAFCEMLGYTEEELTGRSFRDITFPPDLAVSIENFKAVARREISGYELTKRYVRKDGEDITARISVGSLFAQSAEDVSAISVIENITERERISIELQENRRKLLAREDLFQAFMNNSPVVAFMKDEKGRYVYVNRPWQQAFGREIFEVLGRSTHDVWPPNSAHQLKETDEAVLATGKSMQFVRSFIDPTGSVIHLWVSKFPVRDAEGNKYVGGVALDITKQKDHERALKESEEKYRLLVETMNDGVGIADAQGVITYINDRFPEMIGFSRKKLLGKKIRELMEADCRNLFDDQFARRKAGESGVYESVFVSKDRLAIPVILSARPLFDAEGAFRGSLKVATDIGELKRTQEKLLASLREKDVLLQEIHHRVKNNLQLILSLLRIQSRAIQDPKCVEVLQDAESRIFSIALVHEKLYLSPNLSTIEIGHYIKTLASHVLQAYQGAAPPIEMHIEADDITFSIDTAIPVGMILTELISNVLRHAFPQGDRGRLHVSLHFVGNDEYELSVTDNGVGICGSQNRATPKSLGLDLVRTFTDQLDGTVKIDSDEGTSVRIIFRDIKKNRPKLDG